MSLLDLLADPYVSDSVYPAQIRLHSIPSDSHSRATSRRQNKRTTNGHSKSEAGAIATRSSRHGSRGTIKDITYKFIAAYGAEGVRKRQVSEYLIRKHSAVLMKENGDIKSPLRNLAGSEV